MKSPAFRFYPADFMGSPDVQAMDLHEVGAYMFLLCTAWQSERHGYLPDDEGKLRRWARMSHLQWEQSREILLSKFPVAEPGWRANGRMVLEAAKQATYSAAQSEKGKLGGRPKKLVVSKNEAGAFADKAGVKPSVSVSASKDKILSFPGGNGEIPFGLVPEDVFDEQAVVKHVFAYYVEKIGRTSAYILTDERMDVGLRVFRKLTKRFNGDTDKAERAMGAAIEGLAADDWCMGRNPKTKGKRYVEWECHVFDFSKIEDRWEVAGWKAA